jgi:hypothetical protein
MVDPPEKDHERCGPHGPGLPQQHPALSPVLLGLRIRYHPGLALLAPFVGGQSFAGLRGPGPIPGALPVGHGRGRARHPPGRPPRGPCPQVAEDRPLAAASPRSHRNQERRHSGHPRQPQTLRLAVTKLSFSLGHGHPEKGACFSRQPQTEEDARCRQEDTAMVEAIGPGEDAGSRFCAESETCIWRGSNRAPGLAPAAKHAMIWGRL